MVPCLLERVAQSRYLLDQYPPYSFLSPSACSNSIHFQGITLGLHHVGNAPNDLVLTTTQVYVHPHPNLPHYDIIFFSKASKCLSLTLQKHVTSD